MGRVIEIDDGFGYIHDAETNSIQSVQWFKRSQFVEFKNDGYVEALQKTDGSGISRHELRQLMIMWLALNYPDVLAFDELKKEEKIFNGTKED